MWRTSRTFPRCSDQMSQRCPHRPGALPTQGRLVGHTWSGCARQTPPLALRTHEANEGTHISPRSTLFHQVFKYSPAGGIIFFIHSIAANGNIGLSGQAQWLPVAVAARDCAPKGPTVSSSRATTRVKQVSAPRGPAHCCSYQLYRCGSKTQRTCCVSRGCQY